MSVNFIPILVDEKVLTDKIQQLSQTLPSEKIDEAIQEAWRNDALPKDKIENHISFRGFDNFDNTGYWVQADEIRFEILFAVWQRHEESGGSETLRSADALYQFLGAFGYCWITNNGIQDCGITHACAISPVNAWRLHELFKNIDFELLRPIFEAHCKDQYYLPEKLEKKHPWIPSIEVLKNYVAALNGLVAEAATKNKVLYMWAS